LELLLVIDGPILVTGGTGFLGSHVVTALRERFGNEVFVARHADYDLTHEENVVRLFREHPSQLVIHLAGLVGGIWPNRERPAEFFYQNLTMGTFLLHHAWKSGAKKFVAAGAGCGYPENAPNPLRETDLWSGFPQRESAPSSLAKRLLSIQSEAYFRQYGFVSIIGIPGNIYGPNDNFNLTDAHVIPALVRKFVEAADDGKPVVEVWGSGRAARDFVYAGDVADGLIRAAERIERAEVINVSSGIETSVADVVTELNQITRFRGDIRWDSSKPDGQLHRRFDTTKAKALLGWDARTPLREGLELTVDWYRSHRAAARI